MKESESLRNVKIYQTPLHEITEEKIFKFHHFKKGKAIPVTRREDPYGCETSRLPHFLDNLITNGSEVVSFTRRPPFTPRKIAVTHFC
jgi:hypothetical protein